MIDQEIYFKERHRDSIKYSQNFSKRTFATLLIKKTQRFNKDSL